MTRDWIHDEAPEHKPSAAAARLGCKCPECKAALREYLRAYRARRQHEKENEDGTAFYHSHKGQPSKGTARRYLCVHPRCLALAGLELRNGVVINLATGLVDEKWGLPAAKAVA